MNNNKQRILTIDVIRGFALLGLLLVHTIEYFELYWVDPQPGPIRSVVTFIFSGKAYSIFALMFGVSFYLLLEGRDSGKNYSAGRFLWRMAILIAFGYAHSLMYPGDILQQLAVCGLVLLAVHRLPTKILVILTFLLLSQAIAAVQFSILFRSENYTQPVFWNLSGINFQAYMQESFWEFIKHTAWQGQAAKWVLVAETGSLWHIIGLFILGLLIGRARLFERDWSPRQLLLFMGLAAAYWCLLWWVQKSFTNDFPEFMPRWGFGVITWQHQALAMVAFYVFGFILLMRSSVIRKLLAPFAACGRMTLTFYIAQTFLIVPIFYGFGLGLYDTIGQSNALLLALGFWCVQMLFASLWFRYYQYGPLEWLWRALTWWRFDIPNRRKV